jgi:hypothetical protein
MDEPKMGRCSYNESLVKTAENKKKYIDCKLNRLDGKNVLLIALPGYRDGIVKKMKELGAMVECINDKPNDGFVCKSLGRYKIGFYQKIIEKYYKARLEELKDRSFDYVLTIRGEYTPINSLKLIRELFPDSKLILYMWDGLGQLNTKGIELKWQYYDRVYTFDRIDYEKYKAQLSFLPLFYYDDYLPEKTNMETFEFDVAFIGTAHDDRVAVVKELIKQCELNGRSCYTYFYMPHLFVFIYNKLFNRKFVGVKSYDINFRMLPFNEIYKRYADSKCIIDVENAHQHGLTMRSIETLGLKKKFITTNKDIVNYDFYNSQNVLVVDRENPKLDLDFFETPYKDLDDAIYDKYRLDNWILEVLK